MPVLSSLAAWASSGDNAVAPENDATSPSTSTSKKSRVRIRLPMGQETVLLFGPEETMDAVMKHICKRRSLDSQSHALKIQFNDGTLELAENDRMISQYEDWKHLVVEHVGTGEGMKSKSSSHSLNTPMRRRSVIAAPSSKNVSVRLDSEAFPRTISDAAEFEEYTKPHRERHDHSGMGSVAESAHELVSLDRNATPSSRRISMKLRAFSGILLRSGRNAGNENGSSKSLDEHLPTTPTPKVEEPRMQMQSNGTLLGDHLSDTDSLSSRDTHSSQDRQRARTVDRDIRIITRQSLSVTTPTPESNTPSPVSPNASARISRARTSSAAARSATVRRSPTGRQRLVVPDLCMPQDAGPIDPSKTIYDAAFGKHPPEGVTTLEVTVDLPSGSFVLKLGEEVQLETLLIYVCRQHHIAFVSHTLEAKGSNTIIELDRTAKYFKDRDNVVTYNLAHKRKSYNTMCVSEGDADVLLLQNQEGKLRVMAATPEKLIELIVFSPDLYETVGIPAPTQSMGSLTEAPITPATPETPGAMKTFANQSLDGIDGYDYELLDIVLLTYRSFSEPAVLFDELLALFNAELPDDASPEDTEYFEKTVAASQHRILQAIGIWVEGFWGDFAHYTDLRNDLQNFLEEAAAFPQFQEAAMVIQNVIDHKSEEYERIASEQRLVSQKAKGIESMLMAYSSQAIAQQLCFYDYRLFRNIHPIEYLNQIWMKRDTEDSNTPNLDFFISRFDQESYWVATEICSVKDLKKRIAALNQCIEIAHYCFEMGNFFSTFALVAGLLMRPVERLKKTWKGISSDAQNKYAKLVKVCDPSRNMKNYRDQLAVANGPIVPFLPIYLKDLTFLNDGNPSKVRGLINFDKLRMMSKRVKEIVQNRHVQYDFAPMPQVQNYLRKPATERDLAKLKELSNAAEAPSKSDRK